jgi:D-galactarolactone cycloisomerase
MLSEDLRKIRITEVAIHELRGKLKQRFGWSLNWTSERFATLVQVKTDQGIDGWGDGGYGGDLLLRYPELIIGRSPFEVEAIFDTMRSPPPKQGRSGSSSCGGLDVAIWDVIGKALGQSVAKLLGRVYRDRVQPYCTALYRKDWPDLAAGLADEATAWKARGYRAIKMKTGYGPEIDIEIVRSVRRAVGYEFPLAIDSNCAYDAGTAAALGRKLELFHPLWWEEPILAADRKGYALLRQACAIPLASGETLNTDELILDYIQPRLVDVVQPDIEHVGFTGGRRLSHLAWLNHLRLIPHNWGTAVRTASELHWAATMPPIAEGLYSPPVMFEFDRTEHPFRDEVIEEIIDLEDDGLIGVPSGPGIGVHVIEEEVARFRTSLHVVS